MRFRQARVIEPEILDEQTAERAAPSLRDLVRINRLTGGHKVLRLAFESLVNLEDRFTVLDVGAATGDTAGVVQSLYPNARVISLDYRLHHVSSAPPPRVVGDAFRLPVRPQSVDFVYCALFLHHFSDAQIVELLRTFGSVARRAVVVNDLERHILPYYFLPATRWLYGWDRITLHDGPISVQAAFTGTELRSLASRAGFENVRVRVHRPSFRLSMVARMAR